MHYCRIEFYMYTSVFIFLEYAIVQYKKDYLIVYVLLQINIYSRQNKHLPEF